MTLKKRGLGRGLEALLVDVSAKEVNHQLQTLPIDMLQRSNHLPPESVNSDDLQELANFIVAEDTIEPVVVRKTAKNSYEIVAGENRWHAARLAGLTEVPVIIQEMNDHEAMSQELIETIKNEHFNLLHEAEVLKRLIGEFEVMVRLL